MRVNCRGWMTVLSGLNEGWKRCVSANPPSSSRSGDPVRGGTRSANQRFALSPSKGLLNEITRLPPSRSMAARGQSLFAVAQKVTKNASPCTPLVPAVLATGGMRRTAHESFAYATHRVCRRRIYDRPLLRSSARAEGAVELIFDRFATKTTRTRMRASG